MAKTLKPRRVRSNEERNAGRSGFITLKKTGDQFVGHALFKPDAELDDNPGWYEYYEHYTPATGYCPCPGPDDCPLCAEGDTPNSRAKTLWWVDDEIKVFNLNWSMIQEFVDLASEDEPILGQAFRIKRMEGNGKYAIRPKTDKLKAADLKKILKDVDEDMLEKQAMKQMKRVLEELDVEDAMTADDDDDEKEEKKSSKSRSSGKSSETKARKGKPAEDEPEDEDDDEGTAAEFDPNDNDEAEDLKVEVVKIKKKDNIATVSSGEFEFDIFGTDDVDLTEFSKGDTIVVSFEKDEDGDFVVSAAEGAEEDEEETDNDSASDSYSDETVTIVSVNSDDETLTVETEDGTKFELFFLGEGEDDNGRDWSELDLDDYEEGQKVKITAEKDEDGDMLASAFPEPVKSGKAGKSSGKKAGKKAGSKK